MQHITLTTAAVNTNTYTNTIVKKEAAKKIFLFASILACLVLAVNI